MDQNFDYLDLPSFHDKYVQSSESRARSLFFVEGIKCTKCVQKIETQSFKYPGIDSIVVDIAKQTVQVLFNPAEIRISEVARVFQDLGYVVTPIGLGSAADEKWEEQKKQQLLRLGVAGFLAGQIMMLSFSIYFGLAGSLKNYFEIAQWFLYLPIVSYVAWPFYKGFWVGLKQKNLSIDGPMAVASFLGFVISSWHLWKGEGSLYFDSTAGFLFLILGTRFFHFQTRNRYMQFLKPTAWLEDLRVEKWESSKQSWQWIPAEYLRPQDTIRLTKSGICPADAALSSSSADFNFSLLNGESQIKKCTMGQIIPAGAQLKSENCELKVEKTGLETTLGQILARLSENQRKKIADTNLSDRVSQILLGVVLVIGGIYMAWGLTQGSTDYFERGFALVILACPCAIAFGTPLAFSVAMKKAYSKGYIFKSDDVFEKLLKIKKVYFDKTGTLTTPNLNARIESSTLDFDKLKSLVLSLESKSQHPIAEGLRSLWFQSDIDILPVQDYSVIPHSGVSGKIQGREYFFGLNLSSEPRVFGLWSQGQLLAQINLDFEEAEGLEPIFSWLKSQKIGVGIISGDSKVKTQKIAQKLGIPESETFYETTALQKAEILKRHPNSMMVGDGLNDSLAMSESSVSLAVKGGVDTALKTSDIFMVEGDLRKLPELFSLARMADHILKNNLRAALLYNSIGAGLALSGVASPFLAALLMPASSLFILMSTLWSEKKWKFS